MSAPTDTHCPYCALQCAMTAHPDAGGPAAGRGRPARLPDQPGRPVPEGLDQRRGAPRPRPAHAAAAARRRRGAAPGRLGRGARRRRRGRTTGPAASRPGRGGGVRGRRADQREGLPARASSPGSRCGPRWSTTTAGSACPRRRPPATGPSASTAGCRSRWPTSGGGGGAAARQQRRRHDAAAGPAPRRGPGAGRPGRRRPAPLGDRRALRRRRRAAPAAAAGHRPDPAARARSTCWSPRTCSTTATWPSGSTAGTRCAAASRPGGRTGSPT